MSTTDMIRDFAQYLIYGSFEYRLIRQLQDANSIIDSESFSLRNNCLAWCIERAKGV